jgi:hypothetical protein
MNHPCNISSFLVLEECLNFPQTFDTWNEEMPKYHVWGNYSGSVRCGFIIENANFFLENLF